MNILITSASRKIYIVEAFRKALESEGGGRVIAVDESPFAAALYFADDHYLVPPSRESGFIEIMLSLCKSLSIGLLIPTRDEELALFSENRDRFYDIGTFVMVAVPETIGICQDKNSFINFCRKNEILTPKTYNPEELTKEVSFPLFVRPRCGNGGKHAFRINSGDELDFILKKASRFLIQEFIEAPEYTVDLFADFSGKVISVVPRERIRTFGGESFVSKTSRNDEIIAETIKLSTKLNLIGHNTIQCFSDREEVKFIEVNPRFGGGAHLGFEAGADTPLFIVKLLNGEVLQPMIGEFKDDFLMLRYTVDHFVDSAALTERRYD